MPGTFVIFVCCILTLRLSDYSGLIRLSHFLLPPYRAGIYLGYLNTTVQTLSKSVSQSVGLAQQVSTYLIGQFGQPARFTEVMLGLF